MSAMLKPPPKPCGSCPYRRDVPSGIWAPEEYDKLPRYDGEIVEQVQNAAFGIFMCHQRDGSMCGGWLACHGAINLLAMRMTKEPIDPKAWQYRTSVPIFSSGAEARAHGIRDIAQPGEKAGKMIDGIIRKRIMTDD